MRFGIIFCIIYIFISSVPQGKARRRFFSSEEMLSNPTNLVNQMARFLHIGHHPTSPWKKEKQNQQENVQDKGENNVENKLTDFISQFLGGKNKTTGEHEEKKEDKSTMKQLLKLALSQILGKKKPVPDQVNSEASPKKPNVVSSEESPKKPNVVSSEESPKKSNSDWAAILETIMEVLKNLALSVSDKKPDSNSSAIVQLPKKDDEYSLMQNIKSGRIRGPVHVYGQHSKESSDE